MVFIHGGGYTMGSSHQYPGVFLAERDVVVVTFNYRLGPLGIKLLRRIVFDQYELYLRIKETSYSILPVVILNLAFCFNWTYVLKWYNLGFLCTNDANSPGNYGMWDQVRALEFVKENIRNFRGNPGIITIFGQNTGAASVGLQILSPRTVSKLRGGKSLILIHVIILDS